MNGAAHAVGERAIARPHACTQAIQGVVGDFQGFFGVFEGGHCHHWAKNFFLEDAHFVIALEHGRFHIETFGQIAIELALMPTCQHFGSLLFADVEIREDFFQLVLAGLRAYHGVGVEWVAAFDGRHALEHFFHELVVNRLLHQRP